METGPKEFAAAATWDALARGDQAFTLYDFLCRSFALQTSQAKMLEVAFKLVQKEEMIELNWNSPMCDIPPELRENMNFHATSALRVPSIREFGLLPSVHGAMSSVPALYSSPWRSTCCRSYSTQDVFPTLGKTFVVLFGITVLKPAPSQGRMEINKCGMHQVCTM